MITKNVEIFSANKLMFSPAGDGWCKVSPCGEFLLKGPKGTKSPLGHNAPNPSGGRKEKFAQPKSGKLAGSWSCVALVVFMIVWWLDRQPVISCSNNAAFLTAEQIFLKAWKARAFSFTPTYRGEPFYQVKRISIV